MARKKASPRPRATSGPERVSAKERAKRSGFGRHLRAWLAENDRLYSVDQVDNGLPKNMQQFAGRIQRLGESCKPQTVKAWCDEESLPESRMVGPIEIIMACPWRVLDDPKAKIDPKWSPERLALMLSVLKDFEVERIVAAVEKAAAEASRGSVRAPS